MEADEIQCKFPRINDVNGRLNVVRVGQKMDEQYADEEDDGENRRVSSNGGVRGSSVDLGGGVGRFYGWPSSRIVRVSRASGGKDRHSKVLTSKGLRDRRVRLSVNTAIQFYDLQDRLGYDQPSKAVEWLLKAAANSIAELPPMTSLFPDTPKQFSDEKRSSTAGSDQLGFDSAEVNMDGGGDLNYSSQQQVTKSSACSSTSETSKGSGLSLSRSESRMKARERAKERVAEKEKEKETESSHVAAASLNPISQTTSFTELLNGGINNVSVSNTTTSSPNANTGGGASNESNFFLRSPRQWVTSTGMDYFNSGLLGPPAAAAARSGQMHLSANSFTAAAVAASPLFNVAGDHHPELLQFSFVPDHLVPVVNAAAGGNSNSHNGNEYNLNFTISSSGNPSGLAGFNRGTLQSNSSSSLLPHLQRFPDGSPPGFFISTTNPVDNHHQFLSGYDARLQLCYGAANGNNKHSGQKGKGKN